MIEVLLDTSALVEFFDGSELGTTVCAAVEDGVAAVSLISIAEFVDVAARRHQDVERQLTFLRRNVRLLPLTFETCTRVAVVKAEQRKKHPAFGINDAITYCTAREHHLTLLTKDKDFAGLDGVRVL